MLSRWTPQLMRSGTAWERCCRLKAMMMLQPNASWRHWSWKPAVLWSLLPSFPESCERASPSTDFWSWLVSEQTLCMRLPGNWLVWETSELQVTNSTLLWESGQSREVPPYVNVRLRGQSGEPEPNHSYCLQFCPDSFKTSLYSWMMCHILLVKLECYIKL